MVEPTNTIPNETDTTIFITNINNTAQNRILIHNLRHIAKYRGIDMKEMHPEVFGPNPDPETSIFIDQVEPINTIPNETYTVIPIANDTAQNPGERSCILLHNLRHVAPTTTFLLELSGFS